MLGCGHLLALRQIVQVGSGTELATSADLPKRLDPARSVIFYKANDRLASKASHDGNAAGTGHFVNQCDLVRHRIGNRMVALVITQAIDVF